MKNTKLFIAAAAIVAQLAAVSTTSAQDVSAFVTGVAISTNSDGNLTYRPFGNETLIQDCADEMGVTNLTGLHLVYDVSSNALDVVSGTNDTLVCTSLSFSGGVSLSNTNGTRSESQFWVYWGTEALPSGTLTASELLLTNGPSAKAASFYLSGELQFALPGGGTNSATIYQASLTAGPRFFFPVRSPVISPGRSP